jgi:hypothetical protein
LPKAAIIHAAFASFPGCAVHTAAARRTDIVEEARRLLADGVKELNLISQDSTYYGLDLRPNHSRAISSPEKFGAAVKSLAGDSTTICTLLRELNSLPGEFWIRLLYTHPAHWTDELIQTIAECPKGRALRGYSVATHSREHAAAHAPRNLAAIHCGSAPARPRGRTRHRIAHDIYRGFPRGNRGVLYEFAQFHTRDKV